MRRITKIAALGLAPIALGTLTADAQEMMPFSSGPPFKGVIKLDVRDSVPDWAPYTPKRAPAGAPNILIVLYDDTGLASWSPYGGRINMPTLDKLAANGLTYTQWHTCALSSPTRSTHPDRTQPSPQRHGRHHRSGQWIPGRTMAASRQQCATLPQILQDNGWSTFWLGKNHNVPEQDVASGASRKQWPLQMGFDRFYGFLGGETNQWYPDLVEDNRFIEPPYGPEKGYHLSKDLADQAIAMIRDQKASNPSKPWFMWFCPGANHAPHQAPQEYIDKYKGKFDDGYDAYRKWVLPRMIAKGVIPKGTELTPFNPLPPEVSRIRLISCAPGTRSSPKRRSSSRAWLRSLPGSRNTRTPRSAASSTTWRKPASSTTRSSSTALTTARPARERPTVLSTRTSSFNGYPDDLAENMKLLDKLGGPDTYEHYPTGWAAAFSAPYKMFKRYSEYAGGTC